MALPGPGDRDGTLDEVRSSLLSALGRYYTGDLKTDLYRARDVLGDGSDQLESLIGQVRSAELNDIADDVFGKAGSLGDSASGEREDVRAAFRQQIRADVSALEASRRSPDYKQQYTNLYASTLGTLGNDDLDEVFSHVWQGPALDVRQGADQTPPAAPGEPSWGLQPSLPAQDGTTDGAPSADADAGGGGPVPIDRSTDPVRGDGGGGMAADADRALIGDGGSTGGSGGTTAPGSGSAPADRAVPIDESLPEPGTARTIPGGSKTWKVGDDYWLAYTIPGTNTPLVWQVENPDELQDIFGTDTPDVDRNLTNAQFRQLSPWQIGGLSSELVLDGETDPWQQFLVEFGNAAELRPWIEDVDYMAIIATAYMEGRSPTTDELSQTDWWQNHTEAERAWMESSATAGGAEIDRRIEDSKRIVAEALRKAGMSNPTDQVVDLIAEQRLTGKWSEDYTAEQVRKLVDPYAPGELDRGLMVALSGIGTSGDARAVSSGIEAVRKRVRAIFSNRNVDAALHADGSTVDPEKRIDSIARSIMSGDRDFESLRSSVDQLAIGTDGGQPGGLDVTRENEDLVRDLSTRWLGPSIGAMSDTEIGSWAGRIRNDPDAQQELESTLRQQRLAMLPDYTENLTYEDIVAPVRRLATKTWGQPVNDETLLVDLANTGDYTEMAKRLRKEGLANGIAKPVQDALGGLMGTSMGDRVQRSTI